jgi:hypothetical protein
MKKTVTLCVAAVLLLTSFLRLQLAANEVSVGQVAKNSIAAPDDSNSTNGRIPETSCGHTDHDRAAAEQVLRAGGTVTIQLPNDREVEIDLLAYLPAGPFKFTGITLGDFGGVIVESTLDTPIDGAILEKLDDCRQLKSLRLRLVNVTDARLCHLEHLSEISTLVLDRANLYGDGLADVSGLEKIETLSLERNPIGQDSLSKLANLKRLRSLDLSGCVLGDGAVVQLQRLRTLTFLDLRQTRMSSSAIVELRRALPNCRILYQ